MSIDTRKQILKTVKQRKYLSKDFESFNSDLIEFARIHFGDKIRDFTEASLGGLLKEMVSYVGDNLSFYLDHQFHELSVSTAVEPRNIERLLQDAGVDIIGASPAVVNTTFYIEVPADLNSNPRIPDENALPIIYAQTISQAENGTQFYLTEDIDFTDIDNAGNLTATVSIGQRDADNLPLTFFLSKEEVSISGFVTTETFSVEGFEAFKKITLSNENVTDIISVVDSQGNEYYKVDYLTQDTVFKATINRNDDNDLVKEVLLITPAPYRFIAKTSPQTRLTTLTFGGGSGENIDDDIIPDPSQFAIPLYGKKTFSRFTIDPGTLLQTTTLGVLTPQTTLTITYRYGGGLSHNVSALSVRGVTTLNMGFPNSPSVSVASFVRASVDCKNLQEARGGDDAPTLDELKLKVPAAIASQSRIVTKEDILARIYLMPSNFGRVFRASIRTNPNNPLATQLFILSRDNKNNLTVSPDSLKKNLAIYLNQYRLISDAIDILDAQIINITVEFSVVIDPTFNKNLVLQNILARLKKYFNIKNYEIDQPINLSDLHNIIFNNSGVITVQSIRINNISGVVNDRAYSFTQFDPSLNTIRSLVLPPIGAIFEVKYPDFDIIASIA